MTVKNDKMTPRAVKLNHAPGAHTPWVAAACATMDGVRLTRPTILQTAAAATRSSTTLTAPSALPAGVLLVVAQGSHRIASWQHSGDGSADNGTAGSVHGFDPLVLADLLMPKSVLHDHLLDLTIGDCRLVGWPLQLAIV